MRFTTVLAATGFAAVQARLPPSDVECGVNDDAYGYKYPRSLKWAFASYHDSFADGTDVAITSADYETIMDGMYNNAKLNGVSMPMIASLAANEYA